MKDQKDKTRPKDLVAFCICALVAVLFSIAHRFIYTGFLSHRLAQGKQVHTFFDMEAFKLYWDWPFGKFLIIMNVVLVILLFWMIIFFLSRGRSKM
ncbi:hypothetical protein LLG95_10995 [bacterium]|nr:hypothetical protein [bacterium]